MLRERQRWIRWLWEQIAYRAPLARRCQWTTTSVPDHQVIEKCMKWTNGDNSFANSSIHYRDFELYFNATYQLGATNNTISVAGLREVVLRAYSTCLQRRTWAMPAFPSRVPPAFCLAPMAFWILLTPWLYRKCYKGGMVCIHFESLFLFVRLLPTLILTYLSFPRSLTKNSLRLVSSPLT